LGWRRRMQKITLTRITPIYATKFSDEPLLWIQKGIDVKVIGDLELCSGKAFARTPGGFALISGFVETPTFATKKNQNTERQKIQEQVHESEIIQTKAFVPTTVKRQTLRNLRIYKVVANEDSMFDYVQNCASRDTLDGDGSNQRPDWRALYTQFLHDHTIGTIPYRWNRFKMATLLEVTFKKLDVAILEGSIFFDGEISGDQKAQAVKELMKLDLNAPLMATLGEAGLCALVRETEEEWELIVPHNLFAKLSFTEKVIMQFQKHDQYPLTESWRLSNGPWRCFENDFDASMLPDLPIDFT